MVRLILSILSILVLAVAAKEEKDLCKYCLFLVETFEAGLRRTARHHFAGGDTAWEERNLGKYATSETRLIETMEGICLKKSLGNANEYSRLADLEAKCSSIVEENEELIESYYYHHQSTNMTVWLCADRLQMCCPHGHYGKSCAKCPGFELSGQPCFGRGSCDGDGRRFGSGKCECNNGYAGSMCRRCAAEFFEISRTEKSVECESCFDGCSGGCNHAGPKGCKKCRKGYTETEENGCVDDDECQNPSTCPRANEKCVNTPGAFKCVCVDGYKRDDNTNECLLDVEAKPYRMMIPPDLLLKTISMTSLAVIIAFVIWRRSLLLLCLSGIAVALIIYIDMNVNPESIPDDAKKFLGL
ncbi:unnamed protein product [Nippostrongylus brasiliensis]|uniref:Cysteine-rich with EGF-like domain protein 2 n=1 Tax=Nippostrongylus brasiliensis TaxID=27835 RepID=A0A0N4YHG4_NIPBR|nr:hypothetical protein Q1695_006489 [Nippostrongylus brasiliensis]VDL79898.1 unnamed protein product [Nippostrongylus brasiliensis]